MGILRIFYKLFRYLPLSSPALYSPRSSGRGTIKFLITNPSLIAVKSFFLLNSMIKPFLAGQLYFCRAFHSHFFGRGAGCSGSDSCPDGSFSPYMPAPTARSCCYYKEGERHLPAKSAKPTSKPPRKQRLKVFIKQVKAWLCLVTPLKGTSLIRNIEKSPSLKIYLKAKRRIPEVTLVCFFLVAYWQASPKTSLSPALTSARAYPSQANPMASGKPNPRSVLKPISHPLLNSSVQFNSG